MPPKKAKVEDTAASGRPRRSTAAAVANDAPTEATPKKRGRPAKAQEIDASEPPKKRGRPAKAAVEPEPEPEDAPPADAPKKRGRPSKAAAKPEPETEPDVAEEPVEEPAEPPKKRGRPKAEPKTTATAEPTKKRGRAKATATPAAAENDAEDHGEEVTEEVAEPPKKRGRPAKSAAPAVVGDKPPPKKRGRPPKGGETTKIDADDEAAAEQLEDELVEEAEATKPEPSRKLTEMAGLAEADAGKQYWLMKAEQEDRMETTKSGKVINTKFTIDDLRSKTEPEAWDGVRNAVAAKNMRAMRTGDLAFFYASQGKQGRKPGITGIMEIVSEAEPDPTVADPDAYGYVEKESDRGRWCVVRVEFRKKLSEPVTLAELQKYSKDSGVLGNMQMFKQTRLSVSKVTAEEWTFIVGSLIEGYEGEDEELPSTSNGDKAAEIPDSDLPATDGAEASDEAATDLPSAQGATENNPELALPTVESDLPSTGIPAPSPRAASLAPPTARASSRARSRTPKARGASTQPETGNMEAIQE